MRSKLIDQFLQKQSQHLQNKSAQNQLHLTAAQLQISANNTCLEHTIEHDSSTVGKAGSLGVQWNSTVTLYSLHCQL